MEKRWKLRYFDARSGRTGEHTYKSEFDFLMAASEAVNDVWKSDLSATLPAGNVLDKILINGVMCKWRLRRSN
jgi:hypothetical protein